MSELLDALVVGGGPAGVAAAVELARTGRRVVLLERDEFPRFHIGESLLPYMGAIFRQEGTWDALLSQTFVEKHGAEFITGGGRLTRVDFTAQGPERAHTTLQVERAGYDRLRLDRARQAGVEVWQGAQATDLLREGDRVTGMRVSHGGEVRDVRAAWTIDASGRAGAVSRQCASRTMDSKFRMMAIFAHYEPIDPNSFEGEAGDIQIGHYPGGWVWAIPVSPTRLSVGVVTPRARTAGMSREELFEEGVQAVERVGQRIGGADRGPLQSEADFSYATDAVAGPGWIVAGDAGAFVDPIFSAGVFLAHMTGEFAGRTVSEIVSATTDEATALRRYERFYKTGYDTYARLVGQFYEHDHNFGAFYQSLPQGVSGSHVSRVLSGDFWSDDNPLLGHLRSDDNGVFGDYEPYLTCPVYPHLYGGEAPERALAPMGADHA